MSIIGFCDVFKGCLKIGSKFWICHTKDGAVKY